MLPAFSSIQKLNRGMTGNPFTDFMAAGDAEARRLLGVPGTISRGTEVYASVSLICAPAEERQVYLSGGAELEVQQTATVRKDALGGNAPKPGDLVHTGGTVYQVAGVSTTAADPLFTLELAKSL